MIEAFPDFVVPGHKSVVILTKHSPRLNTHEDINHSNTNDKNTSNLDLNKNGQFDLLASLRIYTKDDDGKINVIHKKTWRINENDLWDDSGESSSYKEFRQESDIGKFWVIIMRK